MDDLITFTCSDPPRDDRLLQDFAEGWGLRLQRSFLERGHFSVIYQRYSSISEWISTWDIGYHLLDWLITHDATENGEVRLRLSSFEADEAIITVAEVRADAPCTCHGEQASVDLTRWERQLAWEADTLSFLPHVSSQASAANPEPWTSWLPKVCEVSGEGMGVIWYGITNCQYLVFHQRVIRKYGYHGEAAFKTLQCYRCRRRMIREWAYRHARIMRLCPDSFFPAKPLVASRGAARGEEEHATSVLP